MSPAQGRGGSTQCARGRGVSETECPRRGRHRNQDRTGVSVFYWNKQLKGFRWQQAFIRWLFELEKIPRHSVLPPQLIAPSSCSRPCPQLRH